MNIGMGGGCGLPLFGKILYVVFKYKIKDITDYDATVNYMFSSSVY